MLEPVVSVVVPTYSRSDELCRLLDSFDALRCEYPFEIIIVDDASPDDTPDVARDWVANPASFAKYYHRLERNSGPARARNFGTQQARGRYVVYTDSDCVVEPDWLRYIADPAQFKGSIAGVGGKVLPLDPNGAIGRYNSFHRILEPPDSGIYLVTCNCCFVRELVLDAGGFDEDVSKAGGEDIALCIKLWLKGFRFGSQPRAVLYHDYRESLENFRRTWFNYGEGTGFATARHLPPELADPSKYNRADGGAGWRGNPLHAVHLRHRTRVLWGWFRLSRRRRIPIADSIRFIFLGLTQLNSYRRGWELGEARAHARAAQGGERGS